MTTTRRRPTAPWSQAMVTPAGGGTAVSFCSVICEDLTGNNGICLAGQCDGTCPGSMTCTGDVANNNPPPAVIGKACE